MNKNKMLTSYLTIINVIKNDIKKYQCLAYSRGSITFIGERVEKIFTIKLLIFPEKCICISSSKLSHSN